MQSLFVNGEWLAGKGGLFHSINPATDEVLWQAKEPTPEQINDAVKSAKQAFKSWMLTSYEERLKIVENFSQQLSQNQELISSTISKEIGKPHWEADSEVQAMIAKIKISQQAYQERTGTRTQKLNSATAITRHKPHGVFVVLGPYNFPGHIPNGHIIPALLAGNTLVYKPSELSPLTAEVIMQCWQAAGLPPGVINLVQGTGIIGQKLISHLDINGVLFTGSYQTGLKIHKHFANRPEVILALEMGGNNPLVVAEVKDVKAAAYYTVQSAYITSGQRCSCARRLILLNTPQRDEFIDTLLDFIRKIKVGPYTDEPEPFMGPVVTKQAATHLLSVQDDIIKSGAQVLVPMERLNSNSAFVTPALFDVTSIQNPVDVEYFGPILQLRQVDDMEQAIAEANNTHYGLAAGLFADDENLFQQFYQQVNAGVINWNQQLTGASSAQPFGGVGFSGNHRPSAYYAADYCAYPVASLEAESLSMPAQCTPGFISNL